MHYSMILVFLATLFYFNPALTKDIGERGAETDTEEEFDALTYLERAGYLDDLDPAKGRHHAPDSVKQALVEFQEYAGLPVTGRLDTPTVSQMKQPRCGNPDVIKPSKRQKRYELMNSHWRKHDVTYRFRDYTRDLPEDQQRKVVARALGMWSAVTPLNFHKKDSDPVDILVSFGRKSHGDGYPFDGKGHTLAHAFAPGSRLSGDLHFDDDETWSVDGETVEHTINMETVAAHELGHSMGIGHSKVRGALMYAFYDGKKPHLHQDDIDAAHKLYGPRVTGPPVVDPTTSYKRCDLRIDAIVQVDYKKKIYLFSGDSIYIYTMTNDVISNKRPIDDVFKGAPSAPDAVVYDKYTDKTFFFKDRGYWRFTGYNLDPGFPKPLYLDFQHIDAGFQLWYGDKNIYLFQGDHFTPWNETMHRYPTGYPRKIYEHWKNGPGYVDAAFTSFRDGFTYIVQGQRDYKFYFHRGTGTTSVRSRWLGC